MIWQFITCDQLIKKVLSCFQKAGGHLISISCYIHIQNLFYLRGYVYSVYIYIYIFTGLHKESRYIFYYKKVTVLIIIEIFVL